MSDVAKVNRNILDIYQRRRAGAYAISLRYAALAIQEFRRRQNGGEFWDNQTSQAKDRMFSEAFINESENYVGWFMAHGVQYGVYLELANNGQNAAIRPIVKRYVGRYFLDIGNLYGDKST